MFTRLKIEILVCMFGECESEQILGPWVGQVHVQPSFIDQDILFLYSITAIVYEIV